MRKTIKLFVAILTVCLAFSLGVQSMSINQSIPNTALCMAQKPTQGLISYGDEAVVAVSTNSAPQILPFLKRLFGKNTTKPQTEQSLKPQKFVYVGGKPLGFTINSKGVVVVGVCEVETQNGKVCTITEGEILPGDVLVALNDTEIVGAKSIAEFLRNTYTGGGAKAKLLRDEKFVFATIYPAKDELTNEYKLGLWIRDNSAGVGTLTYVEEDGSFGALGHAVCDLDTGSAIPVSKGNVYRCNVIGVEKSKAGKPGELRGLFIKNSSQLGSIDKNTTNGVFGKIENKDFVSSLGQKVAVAQKGELKMGKATLITTISGTTPKEYDIEIIKTSYTNQSKQHCFVVRISDPILLENTGGIVQGMSGSPILQEGKLVGAITHVFVNDASKGFALHIDQMLNEK